MLLAFSAKSEELDILMLSLTFGNVEVKKYVCLYSFVFLFSMLPFGMEKVVLELDFGLCSGWMLCSEEE